MNSDGKKSIPKSENLQTFVIADIVSFGSLALLASTFYSMSCGPQLSGAMRKVTMCHPPLRGGDDTVPATHAYTFSPLMQALCACMGVKSGIYWF